MASNAGNPAPQIIIGNGGRGRFREAPSGRRTRVEASTSDRRQACIASTGIGGARGWWRASPRRLRSSGSATRSRSRTPSPAPRSGSARRASTCRRAVSRPAPGPTGIPTAAQLLFVREGSLRYQVEGQPVAELGLHETAYLPRGVRHWHGATPGEALTHVSVTFPNDAGEPLPIEWMEPVTDAVYAGRRGPLTGPRRSEDQPQGAGSQDHPTLHHRRAQTALWRVLGLRTSGNRGSHAASAGRQDGGDPSNRRRAATRSQRGMLPWAGSGAGFPRRPSACYKSPRDGSPRGALPARSPPAGRGGHSGICDRGLNIERGATRRSGRMRRRSNAAGMPSGTAGQPRTVGPADAAR